jgi:hypothetical protein
VRYGLLLVTHGDAPHMETTLESAFLNLHPLPSTLYAVVDGPDSRLPSNEFLGPWHITQHASQHGFCRSCRTGWKLARKQAYEDNLDFVFWLENDFRLLRPVPITDMAEALDEHRHVAQMALMRQAVNDREVDAGGVVESRPGAFHDRAGWMEHLEFWTTNPSLIPTRTFDAFDWPVESRCEGLFGLWAKQQGATFGYWGDGGVWVEHIGHRDGSGKGY